MRYEQSAEQTAELLRLILPQISRHGAHFTPWAYAVWYEHLAGINPPLSAAIEARLREPSAMAATQVVELYDQHVQSREMRAFSQLQAGLGDLLHKLGEIAAQSSKGAAQYYQALIAHEEQLASVVDAITLRALLDELKNSTASVRINASLFHTEIEAGREHMQSLHQQLDLLKGEALSDALTGLKNRRGFDRSCVELYGGSDANCPGAAVLLLDIDQFKLVNDTYGHLFGDQVLRAAAQVIAASVKGRDVAVRFGGDEFLVLLPDTPPAGAHSVAEQIRTVFGRARIRRGQVSAHVEQVTLSAGVAVAGPAETMEQVIHRADRALYRAKAEGRNRVVVDTAT